MSGRPRRLGILATMGWVGTAIVVAAAGGDSAFVAVGMSTLMVGYD